MSKPPSAKAAERSSTKQSRWRLAVMALFMLALGLGWMSTAHGMFFFPDEYRFFLPLNVLESLRHHAPERAFALLGTTLDRPLYYLVVAPAGWLQWCSTLSSGQAVAIDPASGWPLILDHLWAPRLFQTLLLLANTALVLRTGTKLLSSRPAGLLAALLYVLWPSTLFFTRHILPVLPAETFLLLSINALMIGITRLREASTTPATKNQSSLPDAEVRYTPFLLAGFWWWCQMATYPGFYYTLIGFVAAILLTARSQFKALSGFLTPVLICTLGWEALARNILHASYFTSLQSLSQSVTEGDPGSGLGFIASYYQGISPLVAAVIAGLTVSGLVYRRNSLFSLFSFIALLLYGWLTLSVAATQTVLYGRTLAPLSLLWIWQAALLVKPVLAPGTHAREKAACMAVALLAYSLLCVPLLQQRFPLDFIDTLQQATGVTLPPRFLHSSRLGDMELQSTMLTPQAMLIQTRTLFNQEKRPIILGCEPIRAHTQPGVTTYLLLNIEFVWPLTAVSRPWPGVVEQATVLDAAPYPYELPLYQFEGLTRANRKVLSRTQVEMLLLKDPCLTVGKPL